MLKVVWCAVYDCITVIIHFFLNHTCNIHISKKTTSALVLFLREKAMYSE